MWALALGLLALIIIYKVICHHFYKQTLDGCENRYIFITGCDTGFGNLLSKRLDRMGCHVFAGCLTESGATELKKSSSERLNAIVMDVSKPESVRAAYSKVKESLPEGRGLWAVVNNAGILGSVGPAEWLSVENFRSVATVNLYGVINVTLTFLPLVKLEKGRIVNMASAAGRITVPMMMPYCGAKYGVESFSDGLRRQMYPYGVKVSIIEPGWTATPITSRNNIVPILTKSWNQASEEIRQEYGEEYFKFCITELFDATDLMGTSNTDPVIDAYQHAILGRYPQARYVVGRDAKFVYLPLQMLPESVSDFLLYISNPKMPLPARLVKERKKC